MQLFPCVGGMASGSPAGPFENVDEIHLGPSARHGTVQHWDHTGGTLAPDEEMEFSAGLAVDGKQAGEWHGGFTFSASRWPQPLTPTTRRGNGFIYGRLFAAGDPHAYPTAAPCPPQDQFNFQSESWAEGGMAPDYEWLFKNSGSPFFGFLRLFEIKGSRKRFAGNIYTRYSVRELGPRGQYKPGFDTGDIPDNNYVMDRMSDAFSMFMISGPSTNGVPHTARLIRPQIVHRPATCVVPDQRAFVA